MARKGVGLLRDFNEKRTLAYLRTNKISSRLEIARFLGVSKNTVSLIVDELIREGVVKELGVEAQKGVGRPKIQIALNPQVFLSLGLLVQEKDIEFAIINYYSEIVESGNIKINTNSAAEFLNQLAVLCQELLSRYPEVLGIGIGIPGLVDPEKGFVHYSARLKWRNVAVKEVLEKELAVPVKVLNRVKAAALDPAKICQDDEAQSLFYLRIDEGVGGALIVNHNIYNGANWTAGEIGHIPIVVDGPLCSCGKAGCLEQLISTPVLEKRLAAVTGEQYRQKIVDFLRFDKDHPQVRQILTEAGIYLGVAIAYIVNIFNPKKIVIDSPYEASSDFKSSAIESASQRALEFPFQQTHIEFTELSSSSAIGAATAVILAFESDYFVSQ